MALHGRAHGVSLLILSLMLLCWAARPRPPPLRLRLLLLLLLLRRCSGAVWRWRRQWRRRTTTCRWGPGGLGGAGPCGG